MLPAVKKNALFSLQFEMKGCTGKHSIGERENKQKERIIHISKLIYLKICLLAVKSSHLMLPVSPTL